MGLDDERRLEGDGGADCSSSRSSFDNKCDESKNRETACSYLLHVECAV